MEVFERILEKVSLGDGLQDQTIHILYSNNNMKAIDGLSEEEGFLVLHVRVFAIHINQFNEDCEDDKIVWKPQYRVWDLC